MSAENSSREGQVKCVSTNKLYNLAIEEDRSTQVSNRKLRMKQISDCCCSPAVIDFTQTTTLHGLKYIWLPEAFAVRRLLWLVLTVTCVAIMSYQILERVVYYYNWPVTVNVKVNYNKTLFFPTVTICNQNAFRASRAAELEYYELLTSMYTGPFYSSDLLAYNASALRLRDLYTETAHTKEDVIVSCSWRGETCGPRNFTEVLTDHGVCYTFNLPNSDDHDILRVISPGAENGLSLTLNVEQYEYMPGPHDAAGVKILIHDHKQFPKVQALGIALPTGTHSFVGMQLITVENLPKPHGECSSPNLEYFTEYSLENCEIECLTALVHKRCGCRLFFMPNRPDGPELCSLSQYFGCYRWNADEIREAVRSDCHCPVPCSFKIFDPTVSYATTSIFVIDRFLSNTNRSALQMKYQKARDITNRFQRSKAKFLENLLAVLKTKFEGVSHTLLGDINVKIDQQNNILSNISKSVLMDWNSTNIFFKYQNYILQKNLVRARDAMNERTFSILAHGVQEFTFSVEAKIQQLVNSSLKEDSVRKVVYLMTKNQLNARLDIAMRTRQNYTELITGFLNASSIFNYTFRGFPRNESDLVLPRELLADAFTRSSSVRRRSLQVETDIISMAYWMKEYGKIAETAYHNRTLNLTHMHAANVQFLRYSREYLQSRSMFFNDFIQWPVDQLDFREQKFSSMKKKFKGLINSMFGYLENVSLLITDIKKSLLANMAVCIEKCENYLLYGNISKVEVAELFLSQNVQTGVNSLKLFSETLRHRCQDIHDSWNHVTSVTQEIWNYTLSQKNLMRYWTYKNLTRYLRNYTVVAEELAEEYSGYRDMFDGSCKFHNVGEEFVKSLERLTDHMREFHQTSRVDSTFVRDNFLKVDTFYKELNYEKITQQKAYDVFALLCDIGGSMGLFIGASVMTIFEILDIIMYHTVTSSKFKT